MKKSFFILCALVACAGCTQIKTPSGASYLNIGFEKKFAELTITSTNGSSLRVKGYTSEASAIAGAVAEGVARGAKP
jgi:hypothetical protein